MAVERSNVPRKKLLASIFTAMFASGGDGAFAQDQGAAIADDLEEITVTGSRVRQTSGFTTPTPVTTLTTVELFDLAPGGTISEQLDSLPQFFNNQTSQRSGVGGSVGLAGSAGAAGLNLRNLGTQRTLVLLDGARVVPTDKRGTVNIDLFPTALMSSVDVVTGGASASYGANAVAGTTNFVLNREFEGLNIKTGAGQHEGGIGEQWEFEISGGKSFLNDRLHVIGSTQALEINEILPDWRRLDNFEFVGWVRNPDWTPEAPAGIPQRLTRPWVSTTTSSPTGQIRGTGTYLDNMQFTMDGSDIVPFVFGDAACQTGPGCLGSQTGGPQAEVRKDIYRSGSVPAGPRGSEAINRSTFVGVQYDLADRLSVFAQAMTGRTESNTSVRGFEMQDNRSASVAVDNAYLPEHIRQVMIDNDLSEFRLHKLGSYADRPEVGDDQVERNVFTVTQWSVGFDYRIPGVEWDLSASWQEGESKRSSQGINRTRIDRLFLAMDAVRHPDTGEIVCRVQVYNPSVEELAAAAAGRVSARPVNPYLPPGDPGNTQPLASPIGLDRTVEDCVPFNVMGSGNVSQAAIDYVGTDKIGLGFVNQDFAEMLLTGDLFELPHGALSFAAGLTWRDESFIDEALPVDVTTLGPAFNVPELGIRGISPANAAEVNLHMFSTVPYVAGQNDVWEYFFELQAPLLETNLLGETQTLGMTAAFRQSDYARSGPSDSWKLGVDLQLSEQIRLRAVKSRDVREPNFSELFDAQAGGGNVTDPRFNNATYQISAISGGNPDLKPELADSSTAGVIWQPSFVPWIEGLQVSLDWYEVQIKDAVSSLGVNNIVIDCERGVQELCSRVVRSEETDQIIRVYNTYLNVAQASVSGLDFELSYRLEPDLFADQFESFTFRWLLGNVNERTTTAASGAAPLNVAGSLNTPDINSVITGNYGIGPFSFQLQGNYVDSVLLDANWKEGIDVDNNQVASMTWWNTRIGYSRDVSSGGTWSVNLNIQNVFDREPPVIPNFDGRGLTQALSNYHDIYGRRYNLSANYSF